MMRVNNFDNLKISIITVCFNSEKTINESLETINQQTFQNIEHLIIDGGSTDNTLSIVKKYSHKKKIISETDNGVYDAMNKGIKYAEGDIIGFLNSDDLYANNNVLSEIANIFQKNPSVDICYSDLVYIKQLDINKVVRYWKSEPFYSGLFSKGWCPPHPTFFVRKSVYQRLGNFNINYKISSDIDLMMRFLELNKINFKYIPKVLIKMRVGGMSNKNLTNILKQNLEVFHILRSHKVSHNPIIFLICKFISRIKQFIFLNKT